MQSHSHEIVPRRVTLLGAKSLGNSPITSLPVGGCAVKSKDQAKHVELTVEDLRTRVRSVRVASARKGRVNTGLTSVKPDAAERRHGNAEG